MSLPRGSELIIILFIVILLFGPGRLSRIAGEFGRGIREFRDGLQSGGEDEEEGDSPKSDNPEE